MRGWFHQTDESKHRILGTLCCLHGCFHLAERLRDLRIQVRGQNVGENVFWMQALYAIN